VLSTPVDEITRLTESWSLVGLRGLREAKFSDATRARLQHRAQREIMQLSRIPAVRATSPPRPSSSAGGLGGSARRKALPVRRSPLRDELLSPTAAPRCAGSDLPPAVVGWSAALPSPQRGHGPPASWPPPCGGGPLLWSPVGQHGRAPMTSDLHYIARDSGFASSLFQGPSSVEKALDAEATACLSSAPAPSPPPPPPPPAAGLGGGRAPRGEAPGFTTASALPSVPGVDSYVAPCSP
jgi:hypothetical protein